MPRALPTSARPATVKGSAARLLLAVTVSGLLAQVGQAGWTTASITHPAGWHQQLASAKAGGAMSANNEKWPRCHKR